jgi:mono/diheme cytochrome c family protein
LNTVKRLRIIITAAIAAAAYAGSFSARPILAAQENTGLNKETPPKATVQPAEDPGAASYAKHCAICHGDQREGILPGFPPLLGINHRMPDNKISDLIHTGKGRMPGFPQ